MTTTVADSCAISSSRSWWRHAGIVALVAMTVAACFWLGGSFIDAWTAKLVGQLNGKKDSSAITVSQGTAASVAAISSAGNDVSPPDGELPLMLISTRPGSNAYDGLASIGIDKKNPQTYRVGALLVNNTRIIEVHADHVVLERDTQRAELYLEGRGAHKSESRLANMLADTTPEPLPVTRIADREILTDYIRPSPVYDGEALRGYGVYPGQHSDMFAQLGLRPGDVVTSINGMPLNDPQSAINQLREIMNGVSVTAHIERDGASVTIALDGGLIIDHQQSLQQLIVDPNAALGVPSWPLASSSREGN